MKNLLLSTTILLFCLSANAQAVGDTVPTYKKLPAIPPFKIMVAPDSATFVREDLQKRRPTIIMIFSPDCEHCIHSTQDLLAHYDLFKKAQIIMVSALPYMHVKKFYDTLKISNYPNIKIGEDRNYFLGSFYQVRSFPSIYLYNKKGIFKEKFDSSTPWETIATFL